MLWPSLLGIVAMMFSDYGNFTTILAASFGNFTVWSAVFMMAVFGVIEQYGLNDYIVRWILTRKIINGRPWVFTFVWFFTVWVMSVICSPFPMIFMFWGLTYKLSEDLGYKKGDSYIMMLLFGIIMAAALSSAILPFKSWILQINGIWTSMSGASAFTYGQHLTLVIPIALCTIIGYVFLMRFVFKADVKPLANINAEMFNQKPLPKMDTIQKFLLWYIPIIILVLFAPSVLPKTWKITELLSSAGVAGLSMLFFVVLCLIRKDGKSIVDLPLYSGAENSLGFSVLACLRYGDFFCFN